MPWKFLKLLFSCMDTKPTQRQKWRGQWCLKLFFVCGRRLLAAKMPWCLKFYALQSAIFGTHCTAPGHCLFSCFAFGDSFFLTSTNFPIFFARDCLKKFIFETWGCLISTWWTLVLVWIELIFFYLYFFLFVMINLKIQIVLLYINTTVYHSTTTSLV